MSVTAFAPAAVALSPEGLFVMERRPSFWCLLRSGKHRCVESKKDHPVHRCACGERWDDYAEAIP